MPYLQVNSAFVVNLHYAFQSSDKLYLIMDLMNGRRGGEGCQEGGVGHVRREEGVGHVRREGWGMSGGWVG